jgi:CRP-like cAMP-binding protein
MNLKVINENEVLFRQGDPGDGMYYIHFGKVGIFTDYGTRQQVKIEELFTDEFVGEMGMLVGAPRSATVVALMDDTQVEFLTADDFQAFFEKNPARVLQLLQQMSSRVRKTTRKYLRQCREAYELLENSAQAPADNAV